MKANYYKLNSNYLNQDELIEEFIPKIKSWVIRATSMLPDSVDVDEIYSAACYGFVEALNRYDKSKDVDFKAYAERRIKGAILDSLRSLDVLSRGMRTKVKDLEEKIARLSTKLGRKPNVREIAEEYDMDESEIEKLMELIENTEFASLDTVVGDDENSSLIDFIKSNILTPEENLEKKELVKILADEIEKLKEKERLVITLYYFEELTMKEIGKVLGVSESRVCQIHNSVVDKLKRRLKKYYE